MAQLAATGEMPWSNPFSDLEQDVPKTGWRTTALAEGRRLWYQMRVIRAQTGGVASPELDEATDAVHKHLVAVKAAVSNRDGSHRLRKALTSSRLDSATINLHAADVVLSRYLPEQDLVARLPRLLAQVEKSFLPEDPRRVEVVERLSPPGNGRVKHLYPVDRQLYVETLYSVNDIDEQQLTRLRRFRNQVVVWTFGLTILALTLAVVGRQAPAAVRLCFSADKPDPGTGVLHTALQCPTGGASPTSGDVPIVLLLGVVGAALSVALGLRLTPSTSTPYGVPAALLFLKLPCGALTAIAGLLLIRGQFVPGFSAIDSPEQIVAYALLFGFAQHLLTRLVDLRGKEVVDKVSNSEPPPPEKRKASPDAAPAHGNGSSPYLPRHANGSKVQPH